MTTVEEEIKNVKRRPGTTGFSVNDVPLWLVKEFMSDVKQKYNDTFWVKLMDLMRKAEAYDTMVANRGLIFTEDDVPPEEKEEVKTMGGLK